MTENQNPAPLAQTDLPINARPVKTGPSWSMTLAIVLLVLVIVLGAGAWFQQKKFATVGREVATQIQTFTQTLTQVQRDSKHALALAESHATRIAQLEQSLRESQNQFAALESAWETFNKGMEDTMLANDVERLLTLASQQLRLAGNVNNAIMALETALSTLLRADRPVFSGLQRSINTDLDRLRAQPLIDVPVLSVRLDNLMSLVARAPLLVPDAAAPRIADIVAPTSAATAVTASTNVEPASTVTSVTPTETQANVAVETQSESSVQPSGADSALSMSQLAWWSQAWDSVADSITRTTNKIAAALKHELSAVVSIQRVSDANALLMSPEQGAQLRANLRTRLLTAQMALLMHQSSVWRSELIAVESSLLERFDPKSVDTIAAVRLVKELATVPVSLTLPDITDSLAALESARLSITNSNKSGN
jgi:uroporphyrin-3 C-methyltransferase